MAARLRLRHQDEIRAKIQTSQLLNVLQDHAIKGKELPDSRIRAAEILLKKTLPDLARTEIDGELAVTTYTATLDAARKLRGGR